MKTRQPVIPGMEKFIKQLRKEAKQASKAKIKLNQNTNFKKCA